MKTEISPAEVLRLRQKSGMSVKEAATFFGMTHGNWKRKETLTGRSIPITNAEYFALTLLAGENVKYNLVAK